MEMVRSLKQSSRSGVQRLVGYANTVASHGAAGTSRRAGSLDNRRRSNYLSLMNTIRRTLDIDAGTDARLTEMAAERGQEIAVVLAEAVALLDSVVDVGGPDVAEDRRRLDAFRNSAQAVPLEDVKTWVASWDSTDELPRPSPRKIG